MVETIDSDSDVILGQTISHFQLLERIGDGGRGIVFKAKDLKLDRFAALKFLPTQFGRHKDEEQRFIREAKAASALEHPNICTIHEIDRTDSGQLFIAMAYYDGETLHDRIARGPLQVVDAVNIGLQIASGLAMAHDRGIVHRDIKPANIMLPSDHVVKVLDFGLAKSEGATQLTGSGQTLGTISYMSPEQSVGQPVDQRTDIWSLGVVLYEMITGRIPFRGDYDQAVVYAIRNDEPESMTDLRTGLPLELEWITNKCLEKEPEYRYKDIEELQIDLKRVDRALAAGAGRFHTRTRGIEREKPPRRGIKPWVIALLALAMISLGALFVLENRGETERPGLTTASLAAYTGVGGLASHPSWSPDGSRIVYATDETGNMDIWMRPAHGGKSEQLTFDVQDQCQPAWSPDGRIIAYASRGTRSGIYLVPAGGGTSWRLTEFGSNPRWSPDNESIAFDFNGNIYIIEKTGGEPRLIVAGTSGIPFAVWASAGEFLVYWNRTLGDICATSISDVSSYALGLVPAGQEVSGLSICSNGEHLAFCLGPFGGNKDVWMVDVSQQPFQTSGRPYRVLATPTDDVHCAIAPDGHTIAFTARHVQRQLYAWRLDTESGMVFGQPRQLTRKGQLNYYPSLNRKRQLLMWTSHLSGIGSLYFSRLDQWSEQKVTRDWDRNIREIGGDFSSSSNRIFYSSTVRGAYEIWHVPSIGGVGLRTTSTHNPVRDVFPACSPVDERVAFYSNRSGNWDIWLLDTDGTPRQLTHSSSNEIYPVWSHNGKSISFTTDRDGNNDIWIMDSDGNQARPLVTGPAKEGWSAWSHDGRYLYFVSDRGGTSNIWMQDARGEHVRQVTPFRSLDLGLPEATLFTKFVVTGSELILPLETRTGNIYVLSLSNDPEGS